MSVPISGSKASHHIVGDVLRSTRGDDIAVDDALLKLRQSALESLKRWPVGKRAQFHFILAVEPAAVK